MNNNNHKNNNYKKKEKNLRRDIQNSSSHDIDNYVRYIRLHYILCINNYRNKNRLYPIPCQGASPNHPHNHKTSWKLTQVK